MVDPKQLGWDSGTVGEMDHRLLKAPHVKLRSLTEGPNGDVVYCVDLRINPPNTSFLSTTALHSFEHFLLAGFQKHLPGKFLSVGPMGCQTGFYLVLFNEGAAQEICRAYESVLADILKADEVPYANPMQCGNYQNHSLELARNLATRVLDARSRWMQIV